MSINRKFQTEDLSSLMDKIVRNSIGLDSYIDDFWSNTTSSNYPPYNLVQEVGNRTRGIQKERSQSLHGVWKTTCRGQKGRIKR